MHIKMNLLLYDIKEYNTFDFNNLITIDNKV
jgi:hypothetical protein